MPTRIKGWTQHPMTSRDPGPADSGIRSPYPRDADRNRSLAAHVDAFDPAAAYLAQLAEGSRRTMREALTKLASWASDGRFGPHELAWHLLRAEQTFALRARLTSRLAPATANKHLAALRGVLRQCRRQGQISEEAYQRAIDLPRARGASPRKMQRLGATELRRLAQACRSDHGPAGARDEALLALLCEADLRRAEAVALEVTDYDLATGRLTVGDPDDRRHRRFAPNGDARRALERWIVVRGGPARGPLFNPVNKGGRIDRRRLSEQAIYIACRKRAAEAGLPPTSPEDLRRAVTPA